MRNLFFVFILAFSGGSFAESDRDLKQQGDHHERPKQQGDNPPKEGERRPQYGEDTPRSPQQQARTYNLLDYLFGCSGLLTNYQAGAADSI